MKFTVAVTGLLVCGILMISFLSGIRILERFDEKNSALKRKLDSTKFIAESFRKTCDGKGFDSFVEWQKTCRALWKLEYIGFSNAADFMNVSNENNEASLYYGKWIYCGTEYEVYCRKES